MANIGPGAKLQDLIGARPLDYFRTTNDYGLQGVVSEGRNNVNVGMPGTWQIRPDNDGDGFTHYILQNVADPTAAAYAFNPDGTFSNAFAPASGDWKTNFGLFLASALSMGLGGAAMGAAGAAEGGVGGAGGFIGEGALSGVPAWDAAGTALGGTGAMGAGGAGLAEGAGLLGDATAAGYGGLDAASTATMGGGSSVAGGASLGAAASAPWYEQLSNGAKSLLPAGGSGSDLASAAVKYGAPIVGGLISANGAAKAADSQAEATNSANAMLRDQYNTTRGDLAPWRDSGVKANNALVSAMGLGPNDGSAGYGSLTKKFTGADLASDPGYQFGLNQGQRQIDQRAASGGSYFSGNALKAAAQYGNDYAGTKFGEAFNRDAATKGQQYGFLSGMSTQGQNAAAMTGQFGATTTGQIAGNTTAQGNATGASQIAQGNALNNALGTVSNTYNQDNLLQQILASQQRQSLITAGNSNGLR